MAINCILCNSNKLDVFWEQKEGIPWKVLKLDKENFKSLYYYKCLNCFLVFKDPNFWPDLGQEKELYDFHNNNIEDQGYRDFLSRLVSPILENISPEMNGLDFGCGPSKGIESILDKKGIKIESYDPLYFSNEDLMVKNYDFITCSEVAEHFHAPYDEFKKLRSILNEKGILGIMTQWVPNDFKNWWYHRDITHVSFYTPKTFEWIAQEFDMNYKFYSNCVTLLSCR